MTHKLDSGDTYGIHYAQEGIVDQHALNGRMNHINDFSWDEIFYNPPNKVRTSLVGLYIGFAYE